MKRRLALALMLFVATPLWAEPQKIKTVSPDEALKHKGKWVNVCGIVRDAARTEKGGKLYFVNAKGETIWATPIHELSTRMSELPGASVCVYGRTYWNLEGLGIDTERVEFVSAGTPARVINDGFPPPGAYSEVAKPTKKFPWGAILAATAVGAAAYGAYQLAKNDDTPTTGAPTPAPPRHVAPPIPRAEKTPPRGINLGAYGGGVTSQELIVLSGDSSRTFLGCLSCSEFESSSIRNDYGRHGEYGGDSIRNGYSRYGSPYAATSACNTYASQPPIIVDRSGRFYGELTMNEYRPNRTRLESALIWLAAVCQGR